MKRYLLNFKMLDVSIVIVNYNTKDLTLSCIKSVFKYTKGLRFEIIVIDNGSGQELNPENQNFRIIHNTANLGFAKANNQGIKIASGRNILLLNSDTEIRDNSIEKIVRFADTTDDAGIVGPRLLNSDGTIQASVFNFPTIKRAIDQYWLKKSNDLEKYTPRGEDPRNVDCVVGAAMLITPQAIKKVGMLDERYFMYFEDLDYCRRVWRSGLRVYYLPGAEVIHHHGASGRNLMGEKNQWRRLVPSSKIYHGVVGHYLFNFILWSGQKWQKLSD